MTGQAESREDRQEAGEGAAHRAGLPRGGHRQPAAAAMQHGAGACAGHGAELHHGAVDAAGGGRPGHLPHHLEPSQGQQTPPDHTHPLDRTCCVLHSQPQEHAQGSMLQQGGQVYISPLQTMLH